MAENCLTLANMNGKYLFFHLMNHLFQYPACLGRNHVLQFLMVVFRSNLKKVRSVI